MPKSEDSTTSADGPLRPHLHARPYGFVRCGPVPVFDPGLVFALIREDADWTIIADRDALQTLELPIPDQLFARISLAAVTALDLVGLTASVSTALAAAGIATNVVAGADHDHLFVPWARRDQALAIVAGLPMPG